MSAGGQQMMRIEERTMSLIEFDIKGEGRPPGTTYMGSFGGRLRIHCRFMPVAEEETYSIASILRSQITAKILLN